VKRVNFDMLRPTLDRLYEGFNYPDSATDPIQVVRRFTRDEDREVVGFLAASLAFGRVLSVIQSIERVLAIAVPCPAAYVRTFDAGRARRVFADVGHRWIRGVDVVALLSLMRQMLDRSGSLEEFFLDGYSAAADDVESALDSFSRRAMDLDLVPAYGRLPRHPGVAFFFPRPSAGSGCKRLNLFLRWMVRRDALDLCVWSRVAPAKLIVPLDTHVVRVGRCLGLTRYVSPGWPMARDITASLRRLDPRDPVKYDFALCHLGMMNACTFNPAAGARRRTAAAREASCPLHGLCRPRAGRPSRFPRPSVPR
jgi:uncharacterized protein (TIGR02757 family)